MQVKIGDVLTPQAAGPWRGQPAIVDNGEGKPRTVLFALQGEGREIGLGLTSQEAQMVGMMLLVCGCIAEGGAPPIVAAEPAKSPLIIPGGRP